MSQTKFKTSDPGHFCYQTYYSKSPPKPPCCVTIRAKGANIWGIWRGLNKKPPLFCYIFNKGVGMGVLAKNRSDSAYIVAVEPPSNSHSYQLGDSERSTKLSPNGCLKNIHFESTNYTTTFKPFEQCFAQNR